MCEWPNLKNSKFSWIKNSFKNIYLDENLDAFYILLWQVTSFVLINQNSLNPILQWNKKEIEIWRILIMKGKMKFANSIRNSKREQTHEIRKSFGWQILSYPTWHSHDNVERCKMKYEWPRSPVWWSLTTHTFGTGKVTWYLVKINKKFCYPFLPSIPHHFSSL